MENILLLPTVIIAVFLKCLVSDSPLRVINGTGDKNNEFPYVVSIETLYSQVPGLSVYRICTGSLIADTWILSAGHCMVPQANVIRYGDMKASRKNMTFTLIVKLLPHPSYVYRRLSQPIKNPVIMENDIGLIKILATAIPVMGKISAVDFKSLNGLKARFAGYGKVYSTQGKDWLKNVVKNNKMPLQLGEGVVVACPTNESIGRVYPSTCLIGKCSDIYHESAFGDSGGPVFVNGKIVAVISAGYDGRKVTILTPVSAYIEWIGYHLNLQNRNSTKLSLNKNT